MKHFALVLVLLVAAFGLAGCKNIKCSSVKPASDAAAATLASVLQCKNVDAVKTSFITLIEQRGMCKPDLTGPISMIVCPIVVPYLVQLGLNQLPPAWECSGTSTEALIMTACEAIPF